MAEALTLAENRRTSIKAAIKRGSAQARREMRGLDRAAIARLTEAYRGAQGDIAAAIRSYADMDGGLRLEVLRDLGNQVDGRIKQLGQLRDGMLDQELVAAAQLGVKAYDGILLESELTRVANEAAAFVQQFTAADGLQLSDRLWRVDQAARDAVGQAVQSAVIQGHGASKAAQDLLARGAPVPPDIRAAITGAQADRVARVAAGALMTGEMNPYDQALRVFRTEINRAHGEAYIAGAESLEDFAGLRFLLSPHHPEADICDMHASVNRYGLGPGVYPDRARCPWPAHPNTLSYTEVVFADEISDADREGEETRLEWLERQPAVVQQGVLGSEMKRGALKYGVLKESQIATPWKVLRRRYEGQGVPIDKLREALGRVPSPASAPPGPVRYAPVGPAVSAGLDAQQHKKLTEHVAGVIDRLHGDGNLPRIPVKNTNSTSYLGVYKYYVFDGRPVEIMVRGQGTHRELTLAHEIGHFIDHQGVQAGQYASETVDAFKEWAETVDKSAAIRRLKALRDGPAQVSVAGGSTSVDKTYVRYLLSTREVWARSYAQYVAKRSGDDIMLRQVREVQQWEAVGQVGYPVQWQDDDFAPIVEAMDRLFVRLGWMREQ